MAELTGVICPGDIDTVYTRTAIDLGIRAFDTDGNEYIYLKGKASTIQYSWVTYDEEFDTTLLAANALGPVAVAQAAIVLDKYGWYQIFGKTTGSVAIGALSDNVVVGRSSADGSVGHSPTAGDIIYGAISRGSKEDGSTATTSLFQLFYPWVDDQTAGH